MKRQLAVILFGLVTLSMAGNAAAAEAWWQLCDSCTTDTHFRYQALNAPGNYTPVYVTNRDTNETRKYNRWTSTEDMDGTLIQLTEVFPAEFPAPEKNVFDQAVEGGQRIDIDVARGHLDLADTAGLQRDPGSVVGDISNGRIPKALAIAARWHLQNANVMPTHETVNEEGGLNIAGANYSGSRTTIRKFSLVVKLTYSDGSIIQFVWEPDGTLTGWMAIDADGNSIPFEGVDGFGPIPLATGSLAGENFGFGAANGAHAEALAAKINGMTGGGLDCWTSASGNRVRVTCKQN